MEDVGNRDKTIPTNLRLLLLLEEIARVGAPMTPTAANEVLGLPKPTVHRLFHRLEQEGFLQRDIDGRSYSAGQRLRKMSVNVLSSSRVRTVRLAVLNALTEDVGETCNIAMPDRDGMVYLDRVETKWPLRIQLPIGTTVPFHCTASGKMYLSTLPPRMLGKYLSSAPMAAQTDKTLTSPDELAKVEQCPIEPGLAIFSSAHNQGTCRMGSSKDNSVVDQNLRLHTGDNIYVMDASVMPSSASTHVMMPIMVVVDRAVHRMLEA